MKKKIEGKDEMNRTENWNKSVLKFGSENNVRLDVFMFVFVWFGAENWWKKVDCGGVGGGR